MAKQFTVVAVAAGMFLLTGLTFSYLAVLVVAVLPFLLCLAYLLSRRVAGARLPILAAMTLGPLVSPETLAGWTRMLHGQNPGGPNGILVLIHLVMVVVAGGLLLPPALRRGA